MCTARVLIRQGNAVFRFLRFETSPDGSLIVLLDRDARSKIGSVDMGRDGLLVPVENMTNQALPSGRFSIHTTGEVHRYARGRRMATIHIEPLHRLTQLTWIGFVSIPKPTRLDAFDDQRHRPGMAATLEVPENVSERLTFLLEIGPKPQESSTYGVALHYELYSIVIRLSGHVQWPSELAEHFIHGMPASGPFQSRQMDRASAELGFYQKIHGSGGFIFREDRGGGYIAMAKVPMVRPPRLKIEFDRPDLYIEIVPFETPIQPTHKVRFLICDKGGRNRQDDLRQHITSVAFEADF